MRGPVGDAVGSGPHSVPVDRLRQCRESDAGQNGTARAGVVIRTAVGGRQRATAPPITHRKPHHGPAGSGAGTGILGRQFEAAHAVRRSALPEGS